jgi:hypothetical protein
MCPVCIASAASLAVGLTSSGGVLALVLTKVQRSAGFRRISRNSKAAVSKAPETQTKEKQS